MPVQTKIQVRRDTAANWTSTNPTLAAGELGFETDTAKFKIGTGSTAWTSLAYQNASGPQGATGPQGPAGAQGPAGSGGSSVTQSTIPPASPSAGDLWFNTDTTVTYIYYDSFWVAWGQGAQGVATPGADDEQTVIASEIFT